VLSLPRLGAAIPRHVARIGRVVLPLFRTWSAYDESSYRYPSRFIDTATRCRLITKPHIARRSQPELVPRRRLFSAKRRKKGQAVVPLCRLGMSLRQGAGSLREAVVRCDRDGSRPPRTVAPLYLASYGGNRAFCLYGAAVQPYQLSFQVCGEGSHPSRLPGESNPEREKGKACRHIPTRKRRRPAAPGRGLKIPSTPDTPGFAGARSTARCWSRPLRKVPDQSGGIATF
jgi:hypothetical protein